MKWWYFGFLFIGFILGYLLVWKSKTQLPNDIPSLITKLKSADSARERFRILERLEQFDSIPGSHIPELIAFGSGPASEAPRSEAEDALFSIASRGALTKILAQYNISALPFFIEALEYPTGRDMTFSVLSEFGPGASDVTPIIVDFLFDQDPVTRYWAAKTIAAIGEPAKHEAQDALLAALDDKDSGVQSRVIEALGAIGADEPEVISRVIEKLGSDASPAAEVFLKAASIDYTRHIPELARCLSTNDSPYQVINILNDLGEAVIPAVINALALPGRNTHSNCQEVLDHYRRASIPQIEKALTTAKGRKLAGCIAAILYLKRDNRKDIGDDIKQMVENGLNDNHGEVRAVSLNHLVDIGKSDLFIQNAAANAIDDPHPLVREYAVTLLNRAGYGRQYIKEIEKLTRDPEQSVCLAAWETLVRLDPSRIADATDYFCQCLSIEKEKETELILIRLFDFGPGAKSAEPTLKALSENEDASKYLRQLARVGIKIVNGETTMDEIINRRIEVK